MSIVYFTGMPGAGKTYWGGLLADANNCMFADMDEYIEQAEGCSIASLFDEKGEEYFRKAESSALRALTEKYKGENAIIACGGGTIMYHNNMQYMMQNGCVVYLEATLTQLKKNIETGKNERPLLKSSNLDNVLEGMLKERHPYYSRAHCTIPIAEMNIHKLEKIIKQCTNQD